MTLEETVKMEVLEWFFEYIGNTSNTTIESAIDYLDEYNMTPQIIELVKVWEHQNHPLKWER